MFKDSKRFSGTDTLIGHGTHAEGKMICESNVRVEGEYQGDIECTGSVIIGESGLARSNIVANDIIVAGKVFGDITTKGRLTITSNGKLYGNVTAGSFILQDGGILNGSCRMDHQQDAGMQPLPETTEPPADAVTAAKDAAQAAAQQAKELAREKARQAG